MCVLLFALSELGREVVLLPLVPVSLVTMLVRTSLKPVDSLLNGVALTFVLAVDDLLVSVALSYRAKGKFVADILPITLVHPVPIEMNARTAHTPCTLRCNPALRVRPLQCCCHCEVLLQRVCPLRAL